MPALRVLLVIALAAVPQVAWPAAVQLPRTGQIFCYSATGAIISCAGTGQDGEDRTGVAWPAPRFTDNGDGTVIDHLTDLIWLRNAGCIPEGSWDAALQAANGLHSGECGLADNSAPGDWRLPNVSELESLIDLGLNRPALAAGHPFLNLDPSVYWTSTTHAHYTANAWCVDLLDGTVIGDVKVVNHRFLAVKDGQ